MLSQNRPIVGIDLSLTSTGVTVIGVDGTITTHLVKSKGAKGASLSERALRLLGIQIGVLELVPVNAFVVIEQPAYSQTGGSHHDRSGLWWHLVQDLYSVGFDADITEVTPGGLKKYATGKGNASKDTVLAAVVKRYADIDVTDNNVADSVVLAAMGARHEGHPIEDHLPLAHLASMDAVRWSA